MNALSMAVGILADATTDKMHEPRDSHDTPVIIVAALGIALVVVLIIWAKMQAFAASGIAVLLFVIITACHWKPSTSPTGPRPPAYLGASRS